MTFAWYALSVRPRHEKTSSLLLANKGLEVFNPLCRIQRRWSDRMKEVTIPLFAGYIFCRFGFERRMAVLTSPGITSIISTGKQPAPVPDEEIAGLQSIVTSGHPAIPWPYLESGRRVQVISGCLEGLVGTVVRDKNICRVVVNVELLQRSVAVEIDRDDVIPFRPLAQPAPHRQITSGPSGPIWQ
jgi:transcription antitermination factor NusG